MRKQGRAPGLRINLESRLIVDLGDKFPKEDITYRMRKLTRLSREKSEKREKTHFADSPIPSQTKLFSRFFSEELRLKYP